MAGDFTKRFSDRVQDYVKYRPGYPGEVLNYLMDQCKLTPDCTLADIGAGTGIFTKLLLDRGFSVYAVEPNGPMLQAATDQLSSYKNFRSVNGTAEITGLEENSIDLIVCAQAFHWFDNDASKKEFQRILKKGRYVALIWNKRLKSIDDFSKSYDQLLISKTIEYTQVNHQNISDVNFKIFFKDGSYLLKKFNNVQIFNEEGFIGRAFSSSYVPALSTPEGKVILTALKEIFSRYNSEGKVSFHYETEIYLGKV